MKVRETIGARIVMLRKAAELNQVKCAEKAGIDPSHLSRVERGLVTLGERAAKKLARALSVKPTVLTYGTIKVDSETVVICPNKRCAEGSSKSARRNRGSRELIHWFCAICGSFLIDKCLSCGRIIEEGYEASNCVACGELLISSDGPVPLPKELIAERYQGAGC